MVRVLNKINHTTVGHPCNPVICPAPQNVRVTTQDQPVLSAGDVFVPHNYCGIDPPHIPNLLPMIPSVTVGGKAIGVELGYLGCGDLILATGPGRVFVGESMASRSSSGGSASNPSDRVVIKGYPKVTYNGTINVRYSVRRIRDPNSTDPNAPRIREYTLEEICPVVITPTNGYTPLLVSSSDGTSRDVNNYPGPPLTTQSGAPGLPAYASLLSQPIKIVFRMASKSYNRGVTINEDTGQFGNINSLLGTFPSRVLRQLTLETKTYPLAVLAGISVGDTKYFPPDKDDFITRVSLTVAATTSSC